MFRIGGRFNDALFLMEYHKAVSALIVVRVLGGSAAPSVRSSSSLVLQKAAICIAVGGGSGGEWENLDFVCLACEEIMNLGNIQCRWRLRTCLLKLVRVLISVGLTYSGYAQVADAQNLTIVSKPDDHKYSLSGTVLNSVTGDPIRRAAVMIPSQAEPAQSGRITLTDGSGRFTFDGVPAGRVAIVVNKPGYFNERGAPEGRVSLQVGPDTSQVVLRMIPGGVIAGRVTALGGKPIHGLTVTAMFKHGSGGRRSWGGGQFQAVTDGSGDFRIAYLPPGSYKLATTQQPALSQPLVSTAREQCYAQVFYPGFSDIGAATPLVLHAGEELTANLSLAPEALYQVSGVVSSSGDLGPALTFERRAGEDFDFMQGVSIESRGFHTKLPAGSYLVRGVTKSGQLVSTMSSVVITSDDSAVPIALTPGMRIPVSVQKELSGRAAVPNGRAEEPNESGEEPNEDSDAPEPSQIGIQLVPKTLSAHPAWSHWIPKLSEIQNVVPGVYTVEIYTQGPWRVKSVQSGDMDLMTEDLTVRAGAQPPSIQVTLKDDAATIDGTLSQSDAQEQEMVLLVQPHAQNHAKATSVEDGKFQFEGVAPGEYALLAVEAADEFDYTDPEVLNPYLSGAVHVSVQPSGKATINLTLSSVSR
jgi:hypothetical protein